MNVIWIIGKVLLETVFYCGLPAEGVAMFKNASPLILTFFLMTGALSNVSGAVDLVDLGSSSTVVPDTVMDDTYMYSSTGGVDSDIVYTANDITVTANTLFVGKSDGVGTADAGFTLDKGLNFITAGGNVHFTTPNSGGDVVLKNIGGISTNAGGNAIFGDNTVTTGQLTMNVSTLSADGAAASTLTFNKNATVTFSGVTGNKIGGDQKVTVDLKGGALGFTSPQPLTLANGVITYDDESTLAVKGGLIIAAQSGLSAADAELNIVAGQDMTLYKELGSGALGSLTIGKSGSEGGTLTLGSGSSLTVDTLIFDHNAVLDGTGATAANTVISAGVLQVKKDFEDSANITTSVTGKTTIDTGATYVVKGTTNVYAGGMQVKGILKGDIDPATIRLGTSLTDLRTIDLDGGSIVTDAGAFKINFADVVITKSAAGNSIDTSGGGTLDLSTSGITVRMAPADTATIDAANGIDANYYRHLLGNIDLLTGGSGKLNVSSAAVIGSGSATQNVTLDVEGYAANFAGGLTLDNYGSISSLHDDGTVSVGSAGNSASGVINANGNNHLDADGKTLTFINASGSTGRMNWNGPRNTVSGNVVQGDFDVNVGPIAQLTVSSTGTTPGSGYEVGSLTVSGKLGLGSGSGSAGVIESHGNVLVKNNGQLFANYGPAFIYNVGAGSNTLKIDSGGMLSAGNGSIYASDFKSVDINGVYIAGLANAGVTPVESSHLTANSNINVSSSGLVTMTAELAAIATAGDNPGTATILLEVDNATAAGSNFKITNNANMSSQSMLGKYGFGLNADSTILYLASVSGKVVLDGSAEDRWQAWKNLQDMWGNNQINEDLGNVIYDVIKGDIVADTDHPAGEKNIGILTAIGSPEGRFVGRDTLEYINGGHLYGVTDVAMETNRTFLSDMSNRAKVLNCSFVAARESFGGDAYASTAMNDYFNNRFWFGGSGLSQNADERDDFSGYKYKSYGFVGGYDRVAAENTAAGFSFAYNKGDYEDKGTMEHDSQIETFSAGLYGTHSNPCGWFVSGHGGYTYSKNEIRELRRDPYAERYSWAESNFRTNTWSFSGVFGYDFRLCDGGFVITPSVGVNYIHAKNSDHDSFLDGMATQRVLGVKNYSVYAPVELGFQYDREMGVDSRLRAELNVGYAYNFRGSGMTGAINFFGLNPDTTISVHGPENPRHSYKAGGGVRYATGAFDIGMRYDYLARSSYKAHRVMASAGWSF